MVNFYNSKKVIIFLISLAVENKDLKSIIQIRKYKFWIWIAHR